MDLTEKLYKVAERWRLRREEETLSEYRYHLQECDKSLALLVQPFFEDSIEIHSARQAGVREGVVFLPEAITYFKDRQKNRDLYIHQALFLAAAQRLNLYYHESGMNSYKRALLFMRHKGILLEEIIKYYPGFLEFHGELVKEFIEVFAMPKNWACREVYHLMMEDGDVDVFPVQKLKRNEPFPEELWLLWGGLGSRDFRKSRREEELQSSPKAKEEKESEIQMQTHFEKEEVDLDKEEINPVSHAFEKLETLDDYQGGNRAADGSDQLAEHSEALKEIQPRHVTRSGEEAASFFKSDFSQGPAREVEQKKNQKKTDSFYYPEWDFKKKKKLENFCRLKVQVCDEGESVKFKEDLLENQQQLISRCRQQLDEIRNTRSWRRGQLDGPEIDLDGFVRHLSDVKNKITSSGHFYQQQHLHSRELQVLILLDFSLSTDSYVANRRVLDIELESIGLWGLLQKSSDDNTIVAGSFSETRHHCYFEYLKKQDETWESYFSRAPQVVPRGYTRLGPAIRHATHLLSQSSARHKVLLILTDGKPSDYDGYEGRYGIEDMRKACLEAESRQIRTRAFAIEKAAKHYFPQMFYSYEILSDPSKLPESLIKTLASLQKS